MNRVGGFEGNEDPFVFDIRPNFNNNQGGFNIGKGGGGGGGSVSNNYRPISRKY